MSVNEKMTAIADTIRAYTGSEELLTLDEMPSAISEGANLEWWDGYSEGESLGYGIGHAEGVEEGYNEGYQDGLAADRNLFDIDNFVSYSRTASGYSYKPKVEGGFLYPAGKVGATEGSGICVPVNAGDIITFSAHFMCPGEVVFCWLGVGHDPVDGVFSDYKQLASFSSGNEEAMDTTLAWAFQIPDGYEWFYFSAGSRTWYTLQMTDINITKQNNATGEQAVAYNILMGVTE